MKWLRLPVTAGTGFIAANLRATVGCMEHTKRDGVSVLRNIFLK